jgi:hypothetical protein
LSTDSESAFAAPVFSVQLNDEQIEAARAELSEERSKENSALPHVRMYELGFDIFDNTIAILRASVDVVDPQSYFALDRSLLDVNLAKVVSILALHAQQKILEPIIRAMQAADHSGGFSFLASARPVLRPPGLSLGYDDVDFPQFPVWPAAIDPLLWANRTLVLESSEATWIGPALHWGHVPDEMAQTLADKKSFQLLQEGTNIFFNDPHVDDFIATNRALQYFYVLFDVLNESQRRVFDKLSFSTSRKELRHMASRVEAASSFIDFVENEYNDYKLGLQSERKRFCHALEGHFSLDTLLRNLSERKNGVRYRLEKIQSEKDRFMHRAMEAALMLLGAVAALDFCLNLSVAAKTQSALDDGVLGLLDLAKVAAPDGFLNGILLLVVAFVIFYSYRRGRRE